MKIDYQKELEELITKLDKRPRVLLHSCCGPCSTQVINFLIPYFDITVLYYNPNIEPKAEYLKRKNEQIKFINEYKGDFKINFMDCDYDNEAYLSCVVGLENEPEGGARCSKCFMLRLDKTATLALQHNFDYFGTTLTVSPHKNSQVINRIGFEIADKYGIKFLPGDFKKNDGYLKSIAYSKEYNLYRQDYCGCHFSNWHLDK
ncbi:MAG: epoxyqueuosine reductase QueH [Bacilli bacterium]|nr:epoxyqueuosine reductase QueH [Bacilli bacterium]